MERTAIEILEATTGTLHLEHLITFANINDQLPLHQIRAKGDLRRIKALGHQEILQQTGVEHDVTMIGHIEIRVMR